MPDSTFWAWFTFGRGIAILWLYIMWHHAHWSVALFITLSIVRMEVEDYIALYGQIKSARDIAALMKRATK
jgi:hypothetical protein